LPNRLLIEGHTDAVPYSPDAPYTNWELSADRANAARHLLEANGLNPNQVAQVRGFADQDLRNKDKPDDPGNRRVSVVVRYQDPPKEMKLNSLDGHVLQTTQHPVRNPGGLITPDHPVAKPLMQVPSDESEAGKGAAAEHPAAAHK
jgi:hypothetical protein